MSYKDYKEVDLKKDDAKVKFTIDIWDFVEEYIDESKMSSEKKDIRYLDDQIEYYIMNGFAVDNMIPRL